MKETAIEWLIKSQKQITQQYNNDEITFSQCINMIEIIIEQAKEIERLQIIEAVDLTIDNIKLDKDKTGFFAMNGEGYYKETFNTKSK